MISWFWLNTFGWLLRWGWQSRFLNSQHVLCCLQTEKWGRQPFCIKFFSIHVNLGKIYVQNKHFSYCNFKASCALLERVAAIAPVWCDTLCGFSLIFEAEKYLLPGPTVCPYLCFDSVCQCGAFFVRWYLSFSVIVSVIVKALIDKIAVGKCFFNLAFNQFWSYMLQ